MRLENTEATLEELERQNVVGRIWQRDHTVWKPGPDEIADRLGWLDVVGQMRDVVPALTEYANDVRGAGFKQLVLLGMGGSSLGPEVLRQTFGSSDGFPELTVLDSVVPGQVRAVTDSIDPGSTLFIVSSKSGGTAEPNALYKHFRPMVERAVGADHAGHSFVAITDEETSLESLGHEQGFRAIFFNLSDIGGRYSVLSYFGLAPAALMGLNVDRLLDRAAGMQEACGPAVPVRDNPGAMLGATMGGMALKGRDKLTLVTSPSIDSFGLWVEQLIAESTGKEGRGIVPVAGDALVAPEAYGDDRLFVYMRLESDDNGASDAAIGALESSGHPVVRLALQDRYDLGAEFFRWEFATAVAGSVLGINPFDQPDVELAKQRTQDALNEYEYEAGGELRQPEAQESIDSLLRDARPGRYLAIMAFCESTGEVDLALEEFRRAVVERYHVATTLGYGPRFLHSTGQLHKGGPDSGLFLQLTVDHAGDIPIPGDPYTFGVLADAQAVGDLRALKERGRHVVRVHLGPEPAAAIKRLTAATG